MNISNDAARANACSDSRVLGDTFHLSSIPQPALEFLESAHMLWDSTVNKAYRVKGEIQPLQNAAADGVRKDISAFGVKVRHKYSAA